MNLRPSGYEPDELPGCSTPRSLEGLWLGWEDSNPRMAGPKPAALPLGDTPTISIRSEIIITFFQFVKRSYQSAAYGAYSTFAFIPNQTGYKILFSFFRF